MYSVSVHWFNSFFGLSAVWKKLVMDLMAIYRCVLAMSVGTVSFEGGQGFTLRSKTEKNE